MNRLFLAFALCGLAVTARAQSSQTITSSGASVVFINTNSSTSASFKEVTSGSPSSTTVLIYGCPSSGLCTQLDSNTITGNATSTRSVSTASAYGLYAVRANWSGGSSVSVTITATLGSASTGGSSGGGTATGNVSSASATQLAVYAANGSTVSGDSTATDDGTTFTYSGASGIRSSGGFSSPSSSGGYLILGPTTFASLPACNSANEGRLQAVTDASVSTWGSTIAGGGSNHVLAYCSGQGNWTVAAK